jgi:hypothetical protein
MLIQIISKTPLWVWLLLAALIAAGWSQTRTRTASLTRITVLPLAMTALSLFGTIGAFGSAPQNLVVWLLAGSVTAACVLLRPLPQGTRYQPSQRQFTVPGSWVPLALMMGIFLSKYVVGVATSIQPALAHHTGFSLTFCALYGAFSGIFLARAARLWLSLLLPQVAAA